MIGIALHTLHLVLSISKLGLKFSEYVPLMQAFEIDPCCAKIKAFQSTIRKIEFLVFTIRIF